MSSSLVARSVCITRRLSRLPLQHTHARLSMGALCATSGVMGPLMVQRATFMSGSAVWRKDIRKGDRGESRRLTFEERAERRMGKTREQRASKEQVLQEAQTIVFEDFPEDLNTIYVKIFDKANSTAMKVLNMAKCLECLETEVSGGHTVLLTKIAQVVKTDNNTIEITPQNNTFGNAILQRVSRFDGSLRVSKEGPKIKVVLPPVTTARRDRSATDIKNLISTFRQKTKQSRTNAGKVIQDCGVDDGALSELSEQLDATLSSFVEEKTEELELLAEEVQSMGIEESDATVSS